MAHTGGDSTAALNEALTALGNDPNNYRARDIAAEIYHAEGQDDKERRLFARQMATAPAGLDWAWHHLSRPRSSLIALDGTDSGLAYGFYGTEHGEGRDFRWTGNDAFVRLQPETGTQPTKIILVLASPREPTAPSLPVEIFLGNRRIGTALVHRELGWNEIEIPMPPIADSTQPITVELRAPTMRIAASDDGRQLGVAVASIGLR
jgi:hypothetical protein